MNAKTLDVARTVGIGVLLAVVGGALAMFAYATLSPLALSYDPVTHMPIESRWFGPACLLSTLMIVMIGVCFMVSGPRGARDGLRLGATAGIVLCVGWIVLELSRGRGPSALTLWQYVPLVALMAASGALGSFARRRVSQ